MEASEFPILRRLEAFPAKQQGRDIIALRDPEGYMRGVVALPPPVYYIASLCDGTRSLRDLQAAYVRRFGDIITSDQLTAIIGELDSKLLLDSATFRAYKRRLDEEYLSLPNRPMTSAGSGYAADPRELVQQLRSMLQEAGEPRDLGGMPTAVIAPHIDLERGRECYGKLYSTLASSVAADSRPLVVILGTCHGEMEGPFALTRKNYLTPFGLVETDIGLAEGLARAAGMDGLGDELSHRSEHSIEVHLPLLSLLFGGADRFRLLPITCNSFHPYIESGTSPGEDSEIKAFVTALQGLHSAMENSALFLASADLAHVGRRFGSLIPLDAVMLSSTMAKDKEMLQKVEAGDAEGFYSYIAAETDARHICGLPPIYTLCKTLEGKGAELIDYGHWFDSGEGSAVTFASLVFPG
jgi:MEMO1 family protein